MVGEALRWRNGRRVLWHIERKHQKEQKTSSLAIEKWGALCAYKRAKVAPLISRFWCDRHHYVDYA